ncbi:hypothetical protein BV898_10956 [Hypsibius exemplaris]|uniref:Uncharacterized protein n=1 Tax=Hypsibius exemplaris TaxID=2072580 RepID=A0A1W0WHX3_HYPEX|nr:hypothetical protein BV898_10956 [Hypsibius exemplaris]
MSRRVGKSVAVKEISHGDASVGLHANSGTPGSFVAHFTRRRTGLRLQEGKDVIGSVRMGGISRSTIAESLGVWEVKKIFHLQRTFDPSWHGRSSAIDRVANRSGT